MSDCRRWCCEWNPSSSDVFHSYVFDESVSNNPAVFLPWTARFAFSGGNATRESDQTVSKPFLANLVQEISRLREVRRLVVLDDNIDSFDDSLCLSDSWKVCLDAHWICVCSVQPEIGISRPKGCVAPLQVGATAPLAGDVTFRSLFPSGTSFFQVNVCADGIVDCWVREDCGEQAYSNPPTFLESFSRRRRALRTQFFAHDGR